MYNPREGKQRVTDGGGVGGRGKEGPNREAEGRGDKEKIQGETVKTNGHLIGSHEKLTEQKLLKYTHLLR